MKRWTVMHQDAELSRTFDDEASAWECAEQASRFELDNWRTWYLFTLITDMDTGITMKQDWACALERSMRKERDFGRQLAGRVA